MTAKEDEWELDKAAVMELRRAQEAFDREIEIFGRVMASALEEINFGAIKKACLVSIAKDLPTSEKTTMIELLREYGDVLAWSHEDMMGLNPNFYQHQIHLSTYAKPVQQHRYRMNPNYVSKVKEEIDKLLRVDFIRPWKLNATMVIDGFTQPFIDGVLDVVVGHEVYSFLDGFSIYNQIRMHPVGRRSQP